MEKFIILCRYESWTDNGKDWSKWFVRDHKPRTLSEAKKRVEILKSRSSETAKITKLGYEFKLIPVQ